VVCFRGKLQNQVFRALSTICSRVRSPHPHLRNVHLAGSSWEKSATIFQDGASPAMATRRQAYRIARHNAMQRHRSVAPLSLLTGRATVLYTLGQIHPRRNKRTTWKGCSCANCRRHHVHQAILRSECLGTIFQVGALSAMGTRQNLQRHAPRNATRDQIAAASSLSAATVVCFRGKLRSQVFRALSTICSHVRSPQLQLRRQLRLQLRQCQVDNAYGTTRSAPASTIGRMSYSANADASETHTALKHSTRECPVPTFKEMACTTWHLQLTVASRCSNSNALLCKALILQVTQSALVLPLRWRARRLSFRETTCTSMESSSTKALQHNTHSI
jgi:hypothetical protein